MTVLGQDSNLTEDPLFYEVSDMRFLWATKKA